MTDSQPLINEIFDALKESFADEEDREYLNHLERFTDYICEQESSDQLLLRLSHRLMKKFEELGEEKFIAKTDEFLKMLDREDEQIKEKLDNIEKMLNSGLRERTEWHNRNVHIKTAEEMIDEKMREIKNSKN